MSSTYNEDLEAKVEALGREVKEMTKLMRSDFSTYNSLGQSNDFLADETDFATSTQFLEELKEPHQFCESQILPTLEENSLEHIKEN